VTANAFQVAGLGRRILAIFYDVLIIIFLTVIITLVVQQLIVQFELVNLEQVQITKEGEKVNVIPAGSPVTPLLKSLWFFISLYFFGKYWTKRGQTPGMKVWKIKAVSNDVLNNKTLNNIDDVSPITWSQSIKRYVFAFFGLGLIWILFDKDNLSLQDKVSNTTLIKIT
jgi:uncharacterized RDD family membrane protein YckC